MRRLTAGSLFCSVLLLSPLSAGERTETKNLPLKPGGSLLVRTANSSITVQGWDKEEVAVTAHIRDDEDHPVKVDYRPSNGRLEVEAIFPANYFRTSWFSHRGPSCSFEVKAPHKLAAELRTSNASIQASELAGRLSVHTSNASVSLKNIEDDAEVHTSNASVHAERINGSLKGSTSNGSLHLNDVLGGIDFRTSNASITADGLDGRGQGIVLTTSNGSIHAGLGAATGELKAHTSGHEKIRVERTGTELLEMRGGFLRIKIPGKQQIIELSTSNSSIVIR